MKSTSFDTRPNGRRAVSPCSCPAIAAVKPVHTHIPGRARFKVAGLYRCCQLKRRLEAELPGVEGIRVAQGSELTGSLLVLFDRSKSVDDVAWLIADKLEIPVRPAAVPRGVKPPLYRPERFPMAAEPAYLSSRALYFSALPAAFLGSSPMVLLPIAFLRTFSLGLFHASPILILFGSSIVILGQIVGKKEGWSRSDAVYFSFATASTVGYGDLRPTQKSTKMLSIAIGLLGLLLTGMVTALGVNAAQKAFSTLP